MKRLALLFMLLAVPIGYAQELSLPIGVRGDVGDFIVVNAETTDSHVKWYVVDSGLKLFPQELQNDTKRAVVIALKAGNYRLLAVSAKGDVPSNIAECVVTIGNPPPDPVPPPPGPTPPPEPDPVPPPVVVGPRTVLIVYESSDKFQPWSNTLTRLRNGPIADYLNGKGHKLNLLDTDERGSGGKPSSTLTAWKPYLEGLKLPAIFIIDSQTNLILNKEREITKETAAEDILALIKAYGG